jgi:hypothetical protein
MLWANGRVLSCRFVLFSAAILFLICRSPDAIGRARGVQLLRPEGHEYPVLAFQSDDWVCALRVVFAMTYIKCGRVFCEGLAEASGCGMPSRQQRTREHQLHDQADRDPRELQEYEQHRFSF